MSTQQSRIALLVTLVLVAGLSWTAREARHRRLVLVGNPGWVTTDPDSLYHVRRVQRALDEGAVEGTDPYLNHPEGSAIPWPPYYTAFLRGALGPFAPDEADEADERRGWVERTVCSFPLYLGVLTTLLAALAGRLLAGNAGAALAGGYHALCTASIVYARGGVGDHHAWVSMLTAGMLLAFSAALGAGVLESGKGAVRTGLLLGLLAGGLLGSWVGSLLYVIQIELVFAWLIFLHARRPFPGLVPLGITFHGAAALVALPAILASPWREAQPWMAVNLSWFHLAFLVLGLAVFVPLAFLRADGVRRAYPWVVGVLLLVLGAFLQWGDSAPGRGIREGFAWVSRVNEFMSGIGESRPLVGAGRFGDLIEALGWGALLLPLAWIAMAVTALRGGNTALIPWVVSVPLLAAQAGRQARFADALVVPMVVALAWGLARLLERRSLRPAAVLLGSGSGALLLAVVMNWGSANETLERWRGTDEPAHRREIAAKLAARTACDWLREHGDSAAPGESAGAVLAMWSWGHVIEWAADRPSVATNFGSYVGEDSFADPCRFLMAEDPDEARALLERRDARYVLVTSNLPRYIETMVAAAVPGQRARYVDGGQVRAAWFRTLGAQLMFDGEVFFPAGRPKGEVPGGSLDFLRLVYVSPLRDPDRVLRRPGDFSPGSWLWERVPGARVEARGDPGSVLEVEIRVRYAVAKRGLTWRGSALAGPDGLASLRVPYATLGPNGQGRVPSDGARWSFGGERGTLALEARDVLEGRSVTVR